MAKPSAASVLLFIAAACLLGATRLHDNSVPIDRSFLRPLATAVQTRDQPGGEDRAADLFWPNFDELVFLTRKGDPLAILVVQRLLIHGNLPQTCGCCSGGLAQAVFADDDMPPGFLDQLTHQPAPDQAQMLSRLDYIFKDTPDAGYETWCEDRARFLAENPAVAAVYEKPDFETPVTPTLSATASADEVPFTELDD